VNRENRDRDKGDLRVNPKRLSRSPGFGLEVGEPKG